jgi:hypothetical protein
MRNLTLKEHKLPIRGEYNIFAFTIATNWRAASPNPLPLLLHPISLTLDAEFPTLLPTPLDPSHEIEVDVCRLSKE